MNPQEMTETLMTAASHISGGDLEAYVQTLYAPDAVLHFLPPGMPGGHDGARLFYTAFLGGFPGVQLIIDDVLVEDDCLVARYHVTGVHGGTFNGIPATGRPIDIGGITFLRYGDGRVVERWSQTDFMGLMGQIGVMPRPAMPAMDGPAVARAAANGAIGSTAANTAIVRAFYDQVINGNNRALIDDLFADGCVTHDPMAGELVGRDAFRGLLGIFDTGFPGHQVTVDKVVAERDLVAVLHTHLATHTGPFLHLAPTGRQVVVEGIELWRVRDGRIVESWRFDDMMALAMQLGMLPAAA